MPKFKRISSIEEIKSLNVGAKLYFPADGEKIEEGRTYLVATLPRPVYELQNEIPHNAGQKEFNLILKPKGSNGTILPITPEAFLKDSWYQIVD